MKRIRPEELPEVLTEKVLAILVEMALEFPKKTFDWAEVSEILEKRGQLQFVLDRAEKVKQEQEKSKRDAISEEEKAKESAKWERIKNDPDPHKFYGNMGQPETPHEFKNRYGVYPPGYDENGNKIKDK